MRANARAGFWMRAGYGAFYAGIACWGPYITLYYRQLGLSGPQIGLLAAIPAVALAVLAPLWGMLADLWGIHRLILRGALALAALAALLLTQVTGFVPILLLVMLLAFVSAPVSPLLDSYGVRISTERGASFGQFRVWGSIGYTVMAWGIGWLMGGKVSTLFLMGYAIGLLITCGTTFGLPPRLQPGALKRTWRGAAGIVRRPAMLVLLLTVYLVSSSTSSVISFFGIYLQSINGSAAQVGTASAVAALSELPVMAFGAALIARIGSRRMLVAALAVYALRMVIYTLLRTPDLVLPFQLLHGFSFAIYLMTSVMLVYELVGHDLAATAQGLLASASAFGQITGALVSGALLDHIGIIAIYRISTIVMVVAILVFLVGFRRFGKVSASQRNSILPDV